MKSFVLLLGVVITFFSLEAASASVKKCVVTEEEQEPAILASVPGQYEWIERDPDTIPYRCLFVYGGGYNRLLYVGRVRVDGDVIPAAIHHYGRNGTETVRYKTDDGIQVSTDQPVEWLCAKGRVGWIRVGNFSDSTIKNAGAIPIGYDADTKEIKYGCLVHSFYSNDYPASLGTIVDGNCEFEINGKTVNSGDFAFWHTLEVLVSL